MEDEDFMKDLDQDQFNGDYKYLQYMDAFVECQYTMQIVIKVVQLDWIFWPLFRYPYAI